MNDFLAALSLLLMVVYTLDTSDQGPNLPTRSRVVRFLTVIGVMLLYFFARLLLKGGDRLIDYIIALF